MIDSSLSSPTLPSSSSTHLCLMAKGERKVQNDDDSSGDDNASNDGSGSNSDDEFESPSYDDLVKLLNQYTKIIRKTRAKNEKLEIKNERLVLSLEKQMMLCHPNSRSSNPLRKSLKINMINLRGCIKSSSLATKC